MKVDGFDLQHVNDRLARTKGKTRRACAQAQELLSDALVASQRTPPKLHVVIDHMDRVRELLAKLESDMDKV